MIFRKSIWSQGPSILLFIILSAAALYLTIKFPASIQYSVIKFSDTIILSIPLPGFALVPILLGVKILHSLFDARYEINLEYVRSIHGLISLRKRDVRLEYADLRGVEIDRGLYGRVVNTGDLKIWSLMPSEVELLLAGVRNPSFYRDLIMERKKSHPLKI